MDSFVDLGDSQGQAIYETANLRPDTTGLPFVVWISQRAGARHDVRVKAAHSPKAKDAADLATYAVSPFRHVEGPRMSSDEEKLLQRWVELNQQALVDFWDAKIEYTEDELKALRRI
jgi:hypothetical protein